VTLWRFEQRWLASIFATILPASTDGRFPGAAALGIERYIEALFREAPRDFALGLRACTWLLALAPPFACRRLCTFAGLPLPERAVLLERLAASERYLVRELPLLFKAAACLGACGLPDVQRAIGIHPTDATPPAWAADPRGEAAP
jgi:hypothetical protein